MSKEIPIRCQGTNYLDISELQNFQGNLKELKESEFKKLKKSIDKYGFRFPVFVWNKFILDGHQRVFTVTKMIQDGYQIGKIPIVEIEADSEKEAKQLVLLVSSRYGHVTDEGLYEFISMNELDWEELKTEIDLPEIDLAKFEKGYLTDEPVDAEPQIDRAEELNKKWQVKMGDLWQVGNHRLLCGDSTKAEDVERVMEGEKADILLTDPPYGINIVRGIGTSAIGGAKPFGRVRQPGGNPSGVVGGKGIVEPRLYHPVIGDDKPFDPQFLLKYAPVLILFGANHYASRLPDSPCWLVWDKGVSPESTFSACELAWVNVGNHIKRYEHRWIGMVRAGNRHDELTDRIHPTQKPVGLMTQILNDYPGNNILDIFLGSGSTMVAIENLKRRCFGIEISPEYVACVLDRMATAFPGIEIKRIGI